MTGSKKDTSSNPGTNPDSRTGMPGLKEPIPPEREWPPKREPYDVKPRVIIKLRDSESFSGGGFTAADLFMNESVDTPGFASGIRFKPHFRPGLLKCVRRRFEDTRRDDIKGGWPDLEAYHSVEVEDPEQRAWLLDGLKDSDNVKTSYLHPGPVEPPQVYADDDPLSDKQTYLDKAPWGINARYAWTVPGGDGKHLRLADVEWGWNFDHEDLEGIDFTRIRSGNQKALAHGTKVLGVIAARDNKKHCVGITPNLPSIVTSGQWDSANNCVSADAVLDAICELDVGDVLLLEAQTEMFGHKNIPLEAEPAVWDLVWIATYLGVVVVAAAGNGDVDLDTVTDDDGMQIFNRNVPDYWCDSGAIIVGCAYQDNGAWQPFNTGSLGSRIDCFASGEGVVTISSDYWGDSRDEWSNSFSATSAATAIVAGACVAVQSILDEQGKPRLSSYKMREYLSNPQYNTKSAGHPADLIGVMPDLKEIIARL